jgi:hypothetical protein
MEFAPSWAFSAREAEAQPTEIRQRLQTHCAACKQACVRDHIWVGSQRKRAVLPSPVKSINKVGSMPISLGVDRHLWLGYSVFYGKTYTPLIAAPCACAAQAFRGASRGGPGTLVRGGCFLMFFSFIFHLFSIFYVSVFCIYFISYILWFLNLRIVLEIKKFKIWKYSELKNVKKVQMWKKYKI